MNGYTRIENSFVSSGWRDYEGRENEGRENTGIFSRIKKIFSELKVKLVKNIKFIIGLFGFFCIVAGVLFGMNGASLLGSDFILTILIALSIFNILCIFTLFFYWLEKKKHLILLPLLGSILLLIVCILYILAVLGIYQTEFIMSSPYILTSFFTFAGSVNFCFSIFVL